MTATKTLTAEMLASMGKEELRQACRDCGISYGKLNNDGMRAALLQNVNVESVREIAVHDFTDLSASQAYSATQCGEVHDGDVLRLENGAVAIMIAAWPTLFFGECEGFHRMEEGFTFDHIDGGKYARSAAKAKEVFEEFNPPVAAGVFAQMLGLAPSPDASSSNGKVTRVIDGKKVESKGSKPQGETRVSRKGYTIQKERVVDGKVIRRPSEGTVCGAVWAEFDKNPEIKAGELQALADANGWNRTNVCCEFYAWRKFNGIKGRSSK